MSVPSEYLKIEHKIHELLSEALTFDDQDMPLVPLIYIYILGSSSVCILTCLGGI